MSSTALAGWQLEWIDSFDGSRVDKSNWTSQTQANYNAEVQCYTDDDTSPNKNYDVSNGTLKIISRKGAHSCVGLGGQTRSWTSGRINSKDKREFLYGRIEARIRFNDLRDGTWPAFWMIENRINEQPFRGDNDFVGWPNPGAGEIDVWEWYSRGSNSYITNFFNTNNCGREVRYNYPGGASDVLQWHDYAMEWDQNSIKFFIDDTLVASNDVSNCAQYKEPMFILLNVAMGGTLGGAINPSLSTATMEVDYVAHCSASSLNNANRCNQNTPSGTIPVITSNPIRDIQSNSFYNYRLIATDVDGDNLTLRASSIPSWLSFNTTTGVLTGTPSTANTGVHSVTLSVSDGTNTVNQTFSITVVAPPVVTIPEVAANNAPTLSSSANLQAEVGLSYQNMIIVSDIDNDSLTLSAPILPNWLVFNSSTGLLSGIPNNSDIGNHQVTIAVTDGIDTVNQSLIINVKDVATDPVTVPNSAPVFTSSPILTGTASSVYSYTLSSADENNDATQITASILPDWLSFNADTNVLAGTPNADDVGIHQVLMLVSDGADSVAQEFNINVASAETLDEETSTVSSSSGGGNIDLFFLMMLCLLLTSRVLLFKSGKKWGGVFYTKMSHLLELG